jgi:hypothetical protein
MEWKLHPIFPESGITFRNTLLYFCAEAGSRIFLVFVIISSEEHWILKVLRTENRADPNTELKKDKR